MRQSSIEFLQECLSIHLTHEQQMQFDGLFQQAKAMHKEEIIDFAYKCRNVMAADEFAITHWYDKTFNEADNEIPARSVSELVCTQCGGRKDIKFSAMKNFMAYCKDCRDEQN